MTPATKRVTAIVVGFVVLVVALNLLARGLDDAAGGREPGGEPGSSYATAGEGLAAAVDLLARWGHRVERVNGDLSDAAITTDAVLVVVDPGPLAADDVAAVGRHLAAGGRVVLAGAATSDVRRLVPDAPAYGAGDTRYTNISARLGQVRVVTAAGSAAYDGAGATTPLVSRGDRVLVATAPVGGGELVLLADSSPLTNRFLADADNAAFAVELAGGGRAPIVFAEGVHGYSSARGLGAIPSHWKVALFGIAGAAVLFAWGRARRLGPPDRPHRPLPPARAEYVDALAAALEHTRDPAAALAELASITRDRADRESIVLDDADRVALATPPNDNSEVRALGRVAARVARRDSESRSEP